MVAIALLIVLFIVIIALSSCETFTESRYTSTNFVNIPGKTTYPLNVSPDASRIIAGSAQETAIVYQNGEWYTQSYKTDPGAYIAVDMALHTFPMKYRIILKSPGDIPDLKAWITNDPQYIAIMSQNRYTNPLSVIMVQKMKPSNNFPLAYSGRNYTGDIIPMSPFIYDDYGNPAIYLGWINGNKRYLAINSIRVLSKPIEVEVTVAYPSIAGQIPTYITTTHDIPDVGAWLDSLGVDTRMSSDSGFPLSLILGIR